MKPMTHKTETALDLDGLAASGFYAGTWQGTNDGLWVGGHNNYRPVMTWRAHKGDEGRLATVQLAAAAPTLLSHALTQRDQIAAKDARIRELEDVLQYLDISDKDASLIRGLLDVTDIWDKHDKAIDRMLSCFPNDPLNKRKDAP